MNIVVLLIILVSIRLVLDDMKYSPVTVTISYYPIFKKQSKSNSIFFLQLVFDSLYSIYISWKSNWRTLLIYRIAPI